MLNEIVQGIAMTLHAAFGDGYEIYQNDITQGLTEPCFFIAVLKPDNAPLQKNRYLRRYPFDIHYFPRTPGDNRELYDMADRLLDCLEFITLPDGSQLHGTEMSYEEADDVLHFFVRYDCTMIRWTDIDRMEDMDMDVTVTGRAGQLSDL
ncbi:MAG: DUF6838 family protein [Butyricicoccus sp.]